MSQMIYEVARKYARDLLVEFWDGSLPVRLSEISSAVRATKYEMDLGEGISGVVVKETDSDPVIVIHEYDSTARRRFTWAHEIGHILERRLIAGDDDYSFRESRGRKYDLHEFFADEFAGALLMPSDEISRMQRQEWTLGQMAQEFGVSVKALAKRMERLSIHPESLTNALKVDE